MADANSHELRERILGVVKKNVLDVVEGLEPAKFSTQSTLADMGADSLQVIC